MSDLVGVRHSSSLSRWFSESGCDLEDYTKNIKILQNKNSASDSIILFGSTSRDSKTILNIVLKMVFKPFDVFRNSLEVEQQIYTNVTEPMINNMHTPHLLSCIGVAHSCKTNEIISKSFSESERIKFKKSLSDIDGKVYDKNIVTFLMLTRSSGITLFDLMSDPKVDTDSRFCILFQLFYTLLCFCQVGLVHNDLHFGNIFVDKLDKPIKRIYYLDSDRWVKLNIKYDIKIYDFDRGSIYHPSVMRNFDLDVAYCKNYDQCNQFDIRRDTSSVFGAFFRYEKDLNVRAFLKTCCSDEFYIQTYKREYPQLNSYKSLRGDSLRSHIYTPDMCLDKLTRVYQFRKQIGKGDVSGDNVYHPPPWVTIKKWYPTTYVDHYSINQSLSKNPVEKYTNIKYVSSINIDRMIIPNNIYIKEFGKDIIQDSYKELFIKFIKRKNVNEVFHPSYLAACYIISVPFTYRFTNDQLKSFILKGTLVQPGYYDLHHYVNDIWNVFNGILPVIMSKI